MREIKSHIVNPCNEKLSVRAEEKLGPGGAPHVYEIAVTDQKNAPMFWVFGFQNGPIKEVGTNGVTHEALLAVLIDRLQHFQKGQYACRENAIALTKLEEAQMWLQKRTRDREARGVEGTHAI